MIRLMKSRLELTTAATKCQPTRTTTILWATATTILSLMIVHESQAQSLIFGDAPTFSEMLEESRAPKPLMSLEPEAAPVWKQPGSRESLLMEALNAARRQQSLPTSTTSVSRKLRPEGGVLRFPEKNFEFTDPGGHWVHRSAKEMQNPLAALALINDPQLLCFMVTVEELGTELRIRLSDLVETAKTHQRRKLVNARFTEGHRLKVAGIDGWLYEATGSMLAGQEQMPFQFVHWVGLHRGVNYQIVTFGRPQEQLGQIAEELRSRFRLIDPNRTVDQASLYPAALVSTRWGVNLDCARTDWIPQAPTEGQSENTFMAARIESKSFCQTVAFSTFGLKPHRDAAVSAILAGCGINLDDVRLKAQPVTLGKFQGVRVRTGVREGFENEVIVLSENDMVWGLVISLPTNDSMRRQRTDQILERLTLAVPNHRLQTSDLLPAERRSHSAMFIRMARHCVGIKQTEQARQLAQLSVSLANDDAELVAAGLDILILSGDRAGALKVLETAPPTITNDPLRQAQLGWLLGEAGRTNEAITAYERVFPSEFSEDDYLQNYLALLAKTEQIEKALSVVNEYLQQQPTVKLCITQSSLLSLAGRHDEAVAVLKKQRDSAPLAIPELSYALAETLLEADRSEEALVELRGLIDSGIDGSQTLLLKGVAELKLDQLVESRRTFELVLQKDKDNAAAKRWLNVVVSKLGQGDIQDVREPIPPVLLPKSLTDIVATKPKLNEGDTAWIARSARAIDFQPGKSFRATISSVIHILDRQGVEAHNNLKFAFTPMQEQIFVNRVDVFDERGQRVGSVKLEDCYVQSFQDSGLATSKKLLHVPVPGLRPGCRLEYQVTYRDRSAPKLFPFTQFDSASSVPTAQSIFFITGDVSSVHWSGPAPAQSEGGLLWNHLSPQRTPTEVYPDDVQFPVTQVSVGDRRESWESVSREYLAQLDSRFKLAPLAQQITKEELQTKPSQSTEEKVNVLAAWVQQQITYQGLEFGRRGQIMPPVEQTIQNRFGDCKDHSLLLVQLLKAAGIPAHLALANTASPVNVHIPSMDQFDHMVVYVEDNRGPRVIDCTNKSVDVSLRVPASLTLTQVLVLDLAKPKFFQIPELPNDQSRLYLDRTIRIEESGIAIVSEKLSIYGYAAAGYRSVFSGTTVDARRDLVQAILLPRGSNGSLQDFQINNLNELSKPLIIVANYEARDQFHNISGQLIGQLPCAFESNLFQPNVTLERQTPFRLKAQRDVTVKTRLTLPIGYELVTPADISKVVPFAELVRITTQKEGVVEIRSRVRRPVGRFEPNEWQSFHKAQAAARELFTPKVQLTQHSLQQVNGSQKSAVR